MSKTEENFLQFKNMVKTAKSMGEGENLSLVKKTIIAKYNELMLGHTEEIDKEKQKKILEEYKENIYFPDEIDSQNGKVFCFIKDWYFWRDEPMKMQLLCNRDTFSQWFMLFYEHELLVFLITKWGNIELPIGFSSQNEKQMVSLFQIKDGQDFLISPSKEFGNCVQINGMDNKVLEKLNIWAIVAENKEFLFG